MTTAFMARAALAALPISPFLLAAPAARAQVTSYTSLTEFNTAATTTATYGFENIAPAGGTAANPSLTPLTITVTNGGSPTYFVYDATASSGQYSLNGTDSLRTLFASSAFVTQPATSIGLGTSVTAFATEFAIRIQDLSSTGTLTVQLYDGDSAIGAAFTSSVSNTAGFIGLTSTQAFNRVTFTVTNTTNGAYHTFDNVRVGTFAAPASAAPEAGSLALLLPVVSGAGMVVAKRRKK